MPPQAEHGLAVRLPVRKALLAMLALALLGGVVTASACKKKRGETLSELGTGPVVATKAVRDLEETRLTHLVAAGGRDGRVWLAARRSGGRLVFGELTPGGVHLEEVIAGAMPGRPALALDLGGAAILAGVLAPKVGEHAKIPPPLEAPREAQAGEGALHLLRRRGEGVWRGLLLADRARAPKVAVGEDGEIHVVFLQPYTARLSQIVHSVVRDGAVSREVVGLGANLPASLVMQGATAWIAFLGKDARVKLRHTRTGGGLSSELVPVFASGSEGGGRDLAHALHVEGETITLGILRKTPEGIVLAQGALSRDTNGGEALVLRPVGRFEKEAVTRLFFGDDSRWAVEGPTATHLQVSAKRAATTGNKKRPGIVRLPGLREPCFLPLGKGDAGQRGAIGLDATGGLRVVR